MGAFLTYRAPTLRKVLEVFSVPHISTDVWWPSDIGGGDEFKGMCEGY